MLFTDLLPALLGQHPNGVPMPLGGPMLPSIAKSPSNATVTPTLGAHNVPPALDPASLMNAMTNQQFKNLESQKLAWQIQQMKDYNTNDVPAIGALYGLGGAGAPTSAFGGSLPVGGGGGGGSAPSMVSNYTADATMEPEQRAFLDSIAGPESKGSYNIRYTPSGGTTFEDLSKHPDISEPGPQGSSTAAGRYQFVAQTWNPLAKDMGLTDFSPVSQDRAGWENASRTYSRSTGRDLLADLKAGDLSRVPGALHGQWPTIGQAVKQYASNLSRYTSGGAAIGTAEAPSIPDLPDTSLTSPSMRIAFGGSQTPLGDTLASAINPVNVPPAPQMAAAMPTGGGGGNIARGNAPPAQFYGDSIAHGTREAAGANGITKIGWRPDQVLGSLTGANPQGAPVVISSGITNSTATDLPRDQWKRDIALVPQQIAAARTSGAGNVALYGVGDGVRDHNEINAALRQIASDGGASFVPLVGTGAYTDRQGRFHAAGWHPQDYNAQNTYTRTQLDSEASPAGATQVAPTPQMAQAGPGATSVTPLGGSAQPAVPTQAPPAFGTLAPNGPPSAPQPGANPQMVAAANLLRKAMAMSAAGLPVGQLMMQAVQNSPVMQAEAARQKGWATVDPNLFQKWHSPVGVRGGVIDPSSGRVVGAVPTPESFYDAKTDTYYRQYIDPVTLKPIGQPLGAEKPGPGVSEKLKLNPQVDPNAFGPQGGNGPPQAGPGYTEPMPTAHGSIIPPASQAAPIVGSADYLRARQKDWAETENDWAHVICSSNVAEQRAMAIMQVMKSYETGEFAGHISDILAKLKAVGVPLTERAANNPAEAQMILKNNFGAVLEQIASFSKRPAAVEVTMGLKNFANPDLQPRANLAIGAQTIGALRWERQLNNDWAQAKKLGWRDPQDFMQAWADHNPVQGFVDKAEADIGPLKGMSTGAPRRGTYNLNKGRVEYD